MQLAHARHTPPPPSPWEGAWPGATWTGPTGRGVVRPAVPGIVLPAAALALTAFLPPNDRVTRGRGTATAPLPRSRACLSTPAPGPGASRPRRSPVPPAFPLRFWE